MATAGLTLWFVRAAARDLANFRPVSNDEVELIEVGYNLASRGVLGSSMYAGFFGAGDHHLWTLPVQHVLDALSFATLGTGMAQARWVSVIAGVCLLWTVGWLALRWYGSLAAVTTELLLVFWHSNLTDGATGVPLLDVARVARYDILALAFVWLAILFFDLADSRRGRWLALAAGASAGLAALSQFYGAGAVAVLGLACVWCHRLRLLPFIALGAAVVTAPWLVYVAFHASDLPGQLTVYGQRADLSLASALAEPTRYTHLLTDGRLDTSRWLLLGVVPAVAYVVYRAVRYQHTGDRLLTLTFVTFGGLLTALDTTKTPLYALLLLPSVCLALSSPLSRFSRAVRTLRPSAEMKRVVLGIGAVGMVSIVLVVVVVSDGMNAYGIDRAEASTVTPYLALGQRLETAIPAGALVLGPERWWLALYRTHPYVSLRALWFQWQATSRPPSFTELALALHPSAVVVNNNVRDDLLAFPPELQQQFRDFLDNCTTQVTDENDPTYFDTQVYAVSGC